ncbi:MAG: hypothetical protein IPH28_25215 [Cytophagaceae bacterium]|nr:hypothetical protein [Cytophagaceae bacterium]
MAKDYFQKFLETKPPIKVLLKEPLRETNTLQMIGSIKEKNAGLEFKNLSQLNTSGIGVQEPVLDGSFVFRPVKRENIFQWSAISRNFKVKLKKTSLLQGTVEPFSSKILGLTEWRLTYFYS